MLRPSATTFCTRERPEPLALTLPQPKADVFELYRRLSSGGSPSFLLESRAGSSQTARYSFLTCDPYMMLSGKGRRCELRTRDQVTVTEDDPFAMLASLLRASRIPRPEGSPPFFGGAIGFFGYDLVRCFEHIPTLAQDDLSLPDLQFAFVDTVVALDHQTQTLHLMFSPPFHRFLGEPRDKLYREGCDRLAEIEARLSIASQNLTSDERPVSFDILPEQGRTAYMDRVLRCKDYIAAGDIYQANLSHRFSFDLSDLLSAYPGRKGRESSHRGGGLDDYLSRTLYGRLRRVNPSPFSALFEFGDVTLVSSSPERLVRLQNRHVDTRPIAGTRPRGRHMTEDRRLAEELLTNAKERAEHIMLVDLERNDLGRVCQFGTVRVDEFMVVERYSHVSHIVSNVEGTLREAVDAFDVIQAVFPGGTITGVPKIRCMEILESLEPVRRGPYTGSLGYLSWSGDLDLNIVIRTVVLTAKRGFVQVGAGIVADSDPAREYDETLLKAEAMFQALRAE